MADNVTLSGYTFRTKDRGAGVQADVALEGNALSATVLVASVTTTAATPVFAADAATRRQVAIKNTGTVNVEISPVSGFAIGAGWPIAVGESWAMNYSGAVYARTASGTGELRMWSED